jgi:mono/diheme cytochrome c family protein
MLVAASTQTSVGLVLLAVAFLVAIVYAFVNVRQGRPEVGSEIELAANRRPYLSDEELEGRKLDKTLTWGLLGLFVIGVGLPLYWLQEPSRQDNAVGDIQRKFRDRGRQMYAPTEEGGFNCAFCHGTNGEGGVTPYTITDAEGRFVKQVDWKGPALNTVLLRYSRDEVRYILEYGRPFSPMPAWGVKGGGPLTEQQLQNLIDYMESFQLTPEQAQAEVEEQLGAMMERKDATCVSSLTEQAKAGLTEAELEEFDEASVDTSSCPPMYRSEGEALFNMGYDDGFAGGAYSCGRCHTQGWSYGEPEASGNGALGPNLTAVRDQFPGGATGFQSQVDFVCEGSVRGQLYGVHGQGSGRMPGFCDMLTDEQIRAIVEYERNLGD